MDAKQVIERASNLQEFEVQVSMPKHFRFNGTIPFNMEILGETAFVTVLAESIEEATQRANDYIKTLEI